MRNQLVLLTLVLLLAGCDSMPSWLGGAPAKEPEKLPGTRVSALVSTSKLQPDAELAATPVTLPPPQANDAWVQHGVQGVLEHPALPAQLSRRQDKGAGDGNAFTYKLVISPVVADGTVFAMDACGYISAHEAKNISNVKWQSHGVADENDNAILGGGMAVDKGRLYASSGRGLVVALDEATGKEIWHQALNIPIRSAPRVEGGHVYVVTVDSQTFALDAANGAILWNQRGVNEGRGFLIEASPAATPEWVVSPYASGEVHVLRAASGDENWSDTVMGMQRESALSQFTGIGGDPVIKDGMLYVAGSAQLFSAFQLETGRRIWDQPAGSVNTPWLAGDYIFVLTTESEVAALSRADGRVRWVRQLPQYKNEKEKKEPYIWSGPVLAGGRLLVVGAHGVMMELKPEDGNVLSATEIPDDIYTSPVVAGGVVYLQSADAVLYALY